MLRQGIGVCALMTAWTWPTTQIACKIGPALAPDCTMVVKQSDLAVVSAILMAQICQGRRRRADQDGFVAEMA